MSKQLNEISAKLTASYLSKARASRDKYYDQGNKERDAAWELHDKQMKRIYRDEDKADVHSKEISDIENVRQKHLSNKYDNYKKGDKRHWKITRAEEKLKKKFQAGNNPPPPEAKGEDKPAQKPDNSFGGKVRRVAQAAKSGLSSLKKRVFGEEYYEDLDYRYTVIPLLDSLLEGNSSDIEHAFNEAVSHRIENAILTARLRIAEEIEINELNKSTLDSYVGKARYQARHAAGVANWRDGKEQKHGGYRMDVVPGHKYSPEAKPWADKAKKRYDGIEQAQRKGSETKAVEGPSGSKWRYDEQYQLAELNKSTLDSYHRKAKYEANRTGAIANALDRSALSRAGKSDTTNIPHDNFNYSPEAKRFADYSKKKFAGMAQARRKGATDGDGENSAGQTVSYNR